MKKYKKYKNSMAEWVGVIPSHWDLVKLKFCNLVIMGQSPDSDDYSVEPLITPFLQGNAEFGKENPSPKYWCDTANKIVNVNDVLISVRAPVGAVNIADKNYGIGRGLAAIQPSKHHYRYIYYYFLTLTEYLNSLSTGSTFTAINTDDLKNLLIPEMSDSEQLQIVSFLDTKTALIDELIEKKQRKIGLLKEQRSAIINQAVTKGINPNAKMKDSVVEWLGTVKQDWIIKKIKYTTSVKGRLGWQNLRAEDFLEEGPYLVTGTDFNNGSINWEGCHRVDEDRFFMDTNIVLQENDILITKDGTIGKIAIVKNKPEQATLNSGVFVTRPIKNQYLQDFMFWVLCSDIFINFIDFKKSGATIQHLYQNVFVEFSFALPSKIEEQQEIVDFIRLKTSTIDKTILIAIQGIAKLKELRQSLISEVVTGKIDVREEQN